MRNIFIHSRIAAPTDMNAPTEPTAPDTTVRTDAEWLDAHWMPFTANRQFKRDPRIIVEGKGAYYTAADGRQIFDGCPASGAAGSATAAPRSRMRSRARSRGSTIRRRSSSVIRSRSSSRTGSRR